MNWNNLLISTVILIVLAACNKKEPDRYEGALKVAQQYFDFASIKEGERILFYSKNGGCGGCRNMVKSELDNIQFKPNLYIITNSKYTLIKSHRMVFDSLDLMDITDLGFTGPTLLIKQGNKLEYLLEVTARNKDSFNLVIDDSISTRIN